MSEPTVAVVGSVNLDCVARAERSPGPGETVLAHEYAEHPGGKGANQAVAAARVATTHLIGMVGSDAPGMELRNNLEAAQVGTDHLGGAAAPTGRALITVTSDGENRILVVPAANTSLSAADVMAALERIQPDTVLAQLEVPLGAVNAAHQWTATHHRRWILNPSPFQPVSRRLIAEADPLIVNEHEARQVLTHLGARADAEQLPLLAQALAQHCRSVIVTAGGNGAYTATSADKPTHHPAPEITVSDTTGGGDEFAGRLAAELTRGRTLAAAAVQSITAASQLVATPRDQR